MSTKEIIFYAKEDGSEPAKEWVDSLDIAYQTRIDQRIIRAQNGNYGDCKTLKNTDGIKELRFDFGKGYRLYFAEDGNKLIILLTGGDKSKQTSDINKAIEYWQAYLANKKKKLP